MSPEQAAGLSSAGRRIATASFDGTARLWDAATGQPLTVPLRHEAAVNQVWFSPDGRCVATASQDGTARLWDTATGQPLTAALRHPAPVKRIAISPDGQRLATASGPEVRLWDVSNNENRPVDVVRTVAQVQAHQHLDATGMLTTLPASVAAERWHRLRGPLSGVPAQAAVEEAWTWHHREASACERERDWYGACWHLGRLLAARPDQLLLWVRWVRARMHGPAPAGLSGREPP